MHPHSGSRLSDLIKYRGRCIIWVGGLSNRVHTPTHRSRAQTDPYPLTSSKHASSPPPTSASTTTPISIHPQWTYRQSPANLQIFLLSKSSLILYIFISGKPYCSHSSHPQRNVLKHFRAPNCTHPPIHARKRTPIQFGAVLNPPFSQFSFLTYVRSIFGFKTGFLRRNAAKASSCPDTFRRSNLAPGQSLSIFAVPDWLTD